MPTPTTPTLDSVVSSWSGSWQYGAPRISLTFTVPAYNPNPPYDLIVDAVSIERSSGGGYSEIIEIGGVPSSYEDTSVEDGTIYNYRIRSRDVDNNYSSYSNVGSAATALPPCGPPSFSATPTSVTLNWSDYARNETGYEIRRDGALVHTTGQNAQTWTDTGLSPSHWYSYYIRTVNAIISSGDSNQILAFTSDPPNAPSGLIVTPTGTTTMRLTWTDNADNETGFEVYRSTDGTSFSPAGSVGPNVTVFDDSSLTSNMLYYYRVAAVNNSGGSACLEIVSASTWADVAQPTGLTVTPWGIGTLEIAFQDNSNLEDGHSVEQSDDGETGWAEIIELDPNRAYYQVTSLGAGTTRYYRVRARQGTGGSLIYSAYSAIVHGTTLSLPGTPTALAVSEYQDKWARLTWTGSAGAAGYKIEKSTGGAYAEIGRVMAGVEYYKAKGLTPGMLYYFKIRAYNSAGNGASYTSPVTVTTRAVYLESKLETRCRLTTANFIFLVEANPLKVVMGFTLTTSKTYTYEYAIQDAGIDFDAVWENGVALTEKTSTADVESTAASWYCDYVGRKLYVHSSTGIDPVNFCYTGSAWFYFTTWQTGATVFNDHYYHPLIAGVPDVSADIKPFWEGSFSTNIGQVQLINKKNPKGVGGFFFDKLFQGFIWQNRPVKILVGAADFVYSEFYPWATGTITDAATLTDSQFTLPLRDSRDALREIKLPTAQYSLDEFPRIDPNGVDKWRPFGFGVVVNYPSICIDTTARTFEFHAGRCKSVEGVYQNGTTLTAGTDYFIDYGRGCVTLARGLDYSTADKVTVSFTGQVDGANDAIQTDAGIFLYGMLNFAGQSLAQLDLDSIYETMETSTGARGFMLYKDTDFTSFVRRLESGSMAFTHQDEYGRIGFRTVPTAANSRVIYVPGQYVFDFSMETGKDSRYRTLNILYAEDPETDLFSMSTADLNTMDWGYGVKATKEIITALVTSAQADTLKAAIIALMDRPTASFGAKKVLYPAREGDLIYLTRARYYSTQGTAANKLMQIISIQKTTAGQVTVRAIEA